MWQKKGVEYLGKRQDEIKRFYSGTEGESFQDGALELTLQIEREIENTVEEEGPLVEPETVEEEEQTPKTEIIEEEGELHEPEVVEEEGEPPVIPGEKQTPKTGVKPSIEPLIPEISEADKILPDIKKPKEPVTKKIPEKIELIIPEDEKDYIEELDKKPETEEKEGPLIDPPNVEELPDLKGAPEKVKFGFNEIKQRFYVYFLQDQHDTLHYLELSEELAYVLGFRHTRLYKGDIAHYMPDLTGSIKQLYVYAPKLVENSIVGNVMAPLLRVVNVQGTPGSIQEVIYTNEYHHRIQHRRISEIQIEIRTRSGEFVKFNWGNTIITLNFKRSI